MAYLARVDADAYATVWEGEPRRYSDAQVLKGKVCIEAFTPRPEWSGPYFGLDLGYAQDPTAAVRAFVHKTTLFVSHEAWQIGCDIDATPQLLDQIPEARKHEMRADNSRPETISYLQRHGYPLVTAVDKWRGSVEDGVAHLRSYERIVVHPRCSHLIEEARQYSFKVDQRTKQVLPEVKAGYDHCIDALRYALSPLIKSAGDGILAWYAKELAALDEKPTAEQERRRAIITPLPGVF